MKILPGCCSICLQYSLPAYSCLAEDNNRQGKTDSPVIPGIIAMYPDCYRHECGKMPVLFKHAMKLFQHINS